MTDADTLRRAALILTAESRKPNGLWLRVLCRILLDTATRIEERTWTP